MIRSINLGLLIVLALVIRAWGGLTLAENGGSSYSIVVAADASPADRRGAGELQTFVRQMSGGAELPIVEFADELPEKAILVGSGARALAVASPLPQNLGEDGFVIETAGDRLIVAGTGPRGTIYGCTALLEDLGVRFYTPSITRVPRSPTITVADVERTEIPAFEYREPFFTEAFDKDWAARLRINGANAKLDESTGGHFIFFPFVHSFDQMIPQSEFDAHPDYFPLIDGKRTGGYVQRCLSNPDVLRIAKQRVRQWIQEHPEAKLIDVSQNDTGKWCECDACQKIVQQYGGVQSGLYLWFVNQVAEDVEKDYPDKLIETLAYQFTEAAPTGIKPRDNVRIRLCPIACCEAHPYEQCSEKTNKDFLKALSAWSKLTGALYIWHYNTNFRHYLMPFPDFDEFPAEARLYRKNGVKGIFFQGAYPPGGGGSDSELRAYVMSKLLWNTDVDADALVTEWMQGVYGPEAARPLRAWFNLLHEKARDPNAHFRIFDNLPVPYLTDDVLAQGEKLFDEAEHLAAGDQTASEYVKKARLSLRYVNLIRKPKVDEEFRSFLADARHFGITQLSEGQTMDQWEAQYIAEHSHDGN